MLSTFCYRHFRYICIEHETYGVVDTGFYLDEPQLARNPRKISEAFYLTGN